LSAEPGRPTQRPGRIFARTGKDAAEDGIRDRLRAHYRKMQRADVRIPARIMLLLEDDTVYDVGIATVTNISPTGALLADVKLPRGSYPARPFKLRIFIENEDWEGIGLEAVPVRFEPKQCGIGVRYTEIFIAAEPTPQPQSSRPALKRALADDRD
jgi:hypothetical protein